MSAKGCPVDSAFAESFFGSLKIEEVYMWEYETYGDVIERLPYFIEEVYNKKRLHSSIGYMPPEEFEEILENNLIDNNKNSCKIYAELRWLCVQILGFRSDYYLILLIINFFINSDYIFNWCIW